MQPETAQFACRVLGKALLCIALSACTMDVDDSNKGVSPISNFPSFMPDNNLDRMDYLQSFTADGGENAFNEIIDEVFEVYAPIVASHGATFHVRREWETATVNAIAARCINEDDDPWSCGRDDGPHWWILMFGGLYRRPEITQDGFTGVVCHELAHHLGGFPYWSQYDWASNEGNSDYTAMLSCLRELWSDEQAENEAAAAGASQEVRDRCADSWGVGTAEFNLCARSIAAGQSLANLLAVLGGDQEPDITTPDPSRVDTTQNYHPVAQCRLDTYVAASVCTSEFDRDLIPEDNEELAHTSCITGAGARPRCWYAPPPVLVEIKNGQANCNYESDFDSVGALNEFSIFTDDINIPLTSTGRSVLFGFQTGGNFHLRARAYINIQRAGTYTFAAQIGTGDSVRVDVGDQTGVPWRPCSRAAGVTTVSGDSINLTRGTHMLEVVLSDDGNKDALVLMYSGPDTSDNMEVVPSNAFAYAFDDIDP